MFIALDGRGVNIDWIMDISPADDNKSYILYHGENIARIVDMTPNQIFDSLPKSKTFGKFREKVK